MEKPEVHSPIRFRSGGRSSCPHEIRTANLRCKGFAQQKGKEHSHKRHKIYVPFVAMFLSPCWQISSSRYPATGLTLAWKDPLITDRVRQAIRRGGPEVGQCKGSCAVT